MCVCDRYTPAIYDYTNITHLHRVHSEGDQHGQQWPEGKTNNIIMTNSLISTHITLIFAHL